MGSDIILCMALIASFAFVIQFLLSILGSDLDTDIDIDSASDLSMSLSDIISFKGITHFILGYSWTTYFSGSHLDMVNISKNGRQEQMRVRCLSGKNYKNGDKVNIKYEEGELSI